jgi:di/tricarboxylate transporter
MVAMIVFASTEWLGLTMLKASMLAAGAMLITRCCTSAEARRGVEWQILLAIAASFGLGKAIENSGLAHAFASSLIGLAGGSPFWSLVVVYGITIVLTELITNNAAAVLVFPIAMQAAHDLNVDHFPFALTVALAASLGFATPLGYQTHMMVYGPGGYRFSDFLRLGIPLDLLCWTITILILPLVFPLAPL